MVLFLLDKCAACSKDLAFNAPRCVRCHVRYCDSTCQHGQTLISASNYSGCLINLERFKEAEALLRKKVPAARRVFGETDELTLRMRGNYAVALSNCPGATLDDLREAVTTTEETTRTSRRVLGDAHPETAGGEHNLQKLRAALRAREARESS